jgi:hypothetical protein
MEDMNLFDRFHTAFEEAPPRGAFERLQRDLIKHSAARDVRRPAFRMRWTRMSLRLTAAVAVVVIAIALVAAYMAGRQALVGESPAGSGTNVAAYQSMVRSDDDALDAVPFQCGSMTEPGCPADLAQHLSALHRWQTDLAAFATPTQFKLIDTQIRAHMTEMTYMLEAHTAAMQAGDAIKFNNATNYANDDLTWLDRAARAIYSAGPASPANYASLIQADYQILIRDCSSCQDLATPGGSSCASPHDTLCPHDLSSAIDNVGMVQADVVQNTAPTELAERNATLQKDLAQADDALIAMEKAQLNGDTAALKSGRSAYADAMVAIATDLQS